MRDLLAQIRAANSSELYYVALIAALTIPDICGALEADDGIASGSRYAAWFDRNLGVKYGNSPSTALTGEDLYRLRCSLLHQGRTQHFGSRKSRYSRILFIEPGTTTNVFHCCVFKDALMIDVPAFVNDLVDAAEGWLPSVEESPTFVANLSAFVTRYPDGLAPFMKGVPIIG